MRLPAVRESDGLDDREPKAISVRSRGIGTAEAFERAREKRLGKAAALVEHVKLHGATAVARCQRDLTAAMPKGVVEHVRQCLFSIGSLARMAHVEIFYCPV